MLGIDILRKNIHIYEYIQKKDDLQQQEQDIVFIYFLCIMSYFLLSFSLSLFLYFFSIG